MTTDTDKAYGTLHAAEMDLKAKGFTRDQARSVWRSGTATAKVVREGAKFFIDSS